jgi:hypothetical protein
VSPILIDDGGSIRIRQLGSNPNSGAAIDGLIDKFKGNSAENFATCTMTIHFHDDPGGDEHPSKVGLNPGDVVTIKSNNGQVVTVTFTLNQPLAIALTGPPIVEAKQENGRRVYIVVNSDSIATVAQNGANKFNAANTPSVYTMVHFRDLTQKGARHREE